MLTENNGEIRQLIEEMIINIRYSSKELLENGNERIINDLGFDSIDIMTLITKIEEKFNIRFEDEMLLIQNFETVGGLTGFIHRIIEKSENM